MCVMPFGGTAATLGADALVLGPPRLTSVACEVRAESPPMSNDVAGAEGAAGSRAGGPGSAAVGGGIGALVSAASGSGGGAGIGIAMGFGSVSFLGLGGAGAGGPGAGASTGRGGSIR